MTTKARVTLVAAAVAIAGGLALWQYAAFRSKVARCVAQYSESLARQIGWNLLDPSEPSTGVMPATAAYSVHDTWPMNYRLVMRTGYRFDREGHEPIAYFVAEPDYPTWVRVLGVEPRSQELLVLREDGGLAKYPKTRLPDIRKNW